MILYNKSIIIIITNKCYLNILKTISYQQKFLIFTKLKIQISNNYQLTIQNEN